MFSAPALTANAQSLNATSLTFGDVVVGTTSASQTINLNNTQSVPLTINSISVSGDFAETSACPLAPKTLAAGTGCEIHITFTPTLLTTETGTLTVNDNAANSPQTAQLSGTGVPPASVSPTTLAFASRAVGTTSNVGSITLTNYQTTPLTITGIAATGDFAETTKCPLSPNTLAARANCTISVTFTPTALGARTGSLTVNDTASNSPQAVQFSGTGLVPVVLTPGSFTFAAQLAGTTSAAKVATLTNDQNVPLSISSISTSGDYAQTSNCPLSPSTLAANASCTISLSFTPTAGGTRSGGLSVSDSAWGSPQTLSLSGTGLLPLSLTPGTLTFPATHPTTTSAAMTITVKNIESGALTITGISTSGDFAQTSNCPMSPNTLAAGSTCTISVTFTPTALGTRTGTLTVTNAASTYSATANLSGTGTLVGLAAISLTPANPALFVGKQQQMTATGTFAKGPAVNVSNYVNWSSSVPAFAPVTSTGLVQALAQGVTAITASYGAHSTQTVLTVAIPALTSITVNPANPSQPVGAYQQFTAALSYSDGSTKNSTSDVTWSSSSGAVATISPAGVASAASAGSTTIQASLGSVTGSTTLTVSQPSCIAAPAGLVGWWTGDGNTVDIAGNNAGTLQNGASYGPGEVGQAFAFGGNGASLLVNSPVYSPQAGTLAFWFLPTGSGTLTGGYAGGQNRAPGFSLDSSGNLYWEFANLSAQSVGQVNLNQWNHAALTYSTSDSETDIGVYLNGVLVDEADTDANTSWNPQVVFGAYLGAQQPSFTGSMDEITVFNQVLSSQQIEQIYGAFSGGMCKPTLQTIAVNPATPSLAAGLSLPLDAVGSYSDSSTHDVTAAATWSSANTSVATVSSGGRATAVATGSASITAALGAVQGSTALTVASSVVSIQVSPQNPTLDVGVVQPLTATGTFSDSSQQNITTSVSWTTSASTVATVAANGQVTCVGAGQATIKATAGSVSGSTLVTVNSATLSSIAVTPATATIVAGTNQPFTATGTFSDGTQQNLTASVTWSSSVPAVATIASNGVSSGLSGGTTTITATMGAVSGSASLTVTTATLAAIQISPQSPSVVIGSTEQFSATAIYSDGTSANVSASATWTSSAATVAAMSSTSPGLALSASVGESRISASFGGLDASTTLTVQDQLASIAIVPAYVSLVASQSQQFQATGTYASGITEDLTNSVTWGSSAPGTAAVSSSGLVTTTAAGQVTITATLGTVTGSENLTVLSPAVVGLWNTVASPMPINPIHTALLSTGQVLVVAGSGACPPKVAGCPSGPPYGPPNGSGALLWDPPTQQVATQFTLSWDLFCNGTVVMADGRVLIDGGNNSYDPFTGLPNATMFDPSTNTFTALPEMAHGRWYPTVLTLSDGTIMTISGLTQTGATNSTVEFYTEAGGWSQEYPTGWTPDLYPRMHLLPNGMVFYSGSLTTSKFFDPSTQTWNTKGPVTNYGVGRLYGASVLLPLTPANGYDPKVIILGGGNPATATTETIDMGASTPAWQWGPSMSQPRIQLNAVILPSGKVLVVGGSVNNEDATTASLNTDLYDPVSNTMSSAGANAYPRLYHSTALLLPDATVFLAGGNPVLGTYSSVVEVYQPAYLFNADGTMATRPSITSAPASISYGNSYTVTTPDAANISSVVLVRNGTVTHAFGNDQREVGLSFTAGSGTLTVTAPPNGNIAPPGYYMLFILNNAGVPSVAAFVSVNSSTGSGDASKSAVLAHAATPSMAGRAQAQIPVRSGNRNEEGLAPTSGAAAEQSQSSAPGSAGIDVSGTWSGKFTPQDSTVAPFTMKVVIGRDSHGNLAGTSTLTSKCLKNAQVRVTVTGSTIVLAGSDEQGDSITVRGTLNKARKVLQSTYILEASSSGRCETDAGTGTLAKQ
jgi:uncharacterized protein YjdB